MASENQRSKIMQVLVEVFPNIQACNLFLTLSEDKGACHEITTDKYTCTIKVETGKDVILKFPKGTSLVSGAVRCVSQDGSHITARAQLDDRTSFLSSLSADLLSNVGSITADSTPSFSELLKEYVVSAQCKQCLRVLICDVKFKRVLPLPSVDWDQASEGWFCHLHGEDGDKLKPSSLQPSSDDCFYSELHFLLHGDAVLNCVSSSQSGNELKCGGCQTSFGARSNESVKLWTHSLMWMRSDDKQILFAKDVSGILLSLIHNIDKDNFGVNCRLVLKVSQEEEPVATPEFLYLVTMNTNQKLLVPEGFSDFSNISVDNSSSVQTDAGAPEKRLRVQQEDSSEVTLRRVYAIKLLYLSKKGEDDLTGSWVDDVNVHILPCSRSFLQEARALLDASAVCLPQAMKKVDDMYVGYIMKNT